MQSLPSPDDGGQHRAVSRGCARPAGPEDASVCCSHAHPSRMRIRIKSTRGRWCCATAARCIPAPDLRGQTVARRGRGAGCSQAGYRVGGVRGDKWGDSPRFETHVEPGEDIRSWESDCGGCSYSLGLSQWGESPHLSPLQTPTRSPAGAADRAECGRTVRVGSDAKTKTRGHAHAHTRSRVFVLLIVLPQPTVTLGRRRQGHDGAAAAGAAQDWDI